MPKYKTHLSVGFIIFFLILTVWSKLVTLRLGVNISIWQLLLYFSSSLLGSLFPDIDTKSKIQKLLYYPVFFIIIICILLKKWVLASFLSLIAFIPILTDHRSLTHRIWFVIIIPLSIPILIFYFDKTSLKPAIISYFFFIAGAISHLILDFGPKKLFR